jgi:hypothetical protein
LAHSRPAQQAPYEGTSAEARDGGEPHLAPSALHDAFAFTHKPSLQNAPELGQHPFPFPHSSPSRAQAEAHVKDSASQIPEQHSPFSPQAPPSCMHAFPRSAHVPSRQKPEQHSPSCPHCLPDCLQPPDKPHNPFTHEPEQHSLDSLHCSRSCLHCEDTQILSWEGAASV